MVFQMESWGPLGNNGLTGAPHLTGEAGRESTSCAQHPPGAEGEHGVLVPALPTAASSPWRAAAPLVCDAGVAQRVPGPEATSQCVKDERSLLDMDLGTAHNIAFSHILAL